MHQLAQGTNVVLIVGVVEMEAEVVQEVLVAPAVTVDPVVVVAQNAYVLNSTKRLSASVE
jgi:hypothetical protein